MRLLQQTNEIYLQLVSMKARAHRSAAVWPLDCHVSAILERSERYQESHRRFVLYEFPRAGCIVTR
jgi:hypothetical protein